MANWMIIALLLGTCSLALWAGVVHMVRSRGDSLCTAALACMATLSTIMTTGPVMSPFG
jgi:hypothetical protein